MNNEKGKIKNKKTSEVTLFPPGPTWGAYAFNSPQMRLMARAHDVVLDLIEEGEKQSVEILRLNHGEHTVQGLELEALMIARRKVIKIFFQICDAGHLTFRLDEKAFQFFPVKNKQRIRDLFTTEFLRLALDIRKIINQAE